jgi:hypothetical protein
MNPALYGLPCACARLTYGDPRVWTKGSGSFSLNRAHLWRHLEECEPDRLASFVRGLRCGQFVAFGRPGSRGARFEFIPAAVWPPDLIVERDNGELNIADQRYWDVHVSALDGVPLALAMRVFGPPELVSEECR